MERIKTFLKAQLLEYVVLRGGGNQEKFQPWTGDNYPATCLYLDLNPGEECFTTALSRPLKIITNGYKMQTD